MPGGRKRKRETTAITPTAPSAMDIFRQHFETRFAPLKVTKKPKARAAPAVSDSEPRKTGMATPGKEVGETASQVIQVDATKHVSGIVPKAPRRELKSFMSSKPPTLLSPHPPSQPPKPTTTQDEDDQQDLKNDLALHRLLRESHLLTPGTHTLEATGKNRLAALDSRIQSLGGKDIRAQKNTPMAIRKGITAARVQREEKRRREAKEAGIVLEKDATNKKGRIGKGNGNKRDGRGGFGPGVGRFRGGALVLSQRDVMDIEGHGNIRHGSARNTGRRNMQ